MVAFEVGINDRQYRVVQEQHARRFLDVVRQQADASQEPSERSLNPNDLWRRSQDDWVFGAGQSHFDDDESVRKRFRSSSGVDVFGTKGRLSLLNGTVRVDTGHPFGTIGKAVKADGYLWVQRVGEATVSRWDGTNWVDSGAVAAGQTVVDLCSDGSNVYLAAATPDRTAGGVYVIGVGTTTPTLLNEVIPDRVAYVRGRLLVSAGPSLFNITDIADTTAPTALTANVVNSDFEWDAFGEGLSYIYVSGGSGDLSYLYRISLREDGSALTPPVVAVQLPDGERVTSIQSYFGVLVLGTTRGVRVCAMNGGTVVLGPLAYEGGPVTALEPQGKWVWFGMDGGLGRVDLSRLVPNFDLLFGWASDLQAGVAGQVHSAVTWEGKRLFTMDDRVVLEDTDVREPLGTLSSGLITYGMSDAKALMFVDVVASYEHPADSVTVEVLDGDGAVLVAGVFTQASTSHTFEVDELVEAAEFRVTLASGDGVSSPSVSRVTLRAMPAPKRTEQIVVPLDLRHQVSSAQSAVTFYEFWDDYNWLRGLVLSGETVDYREFDQTYRAIVENVQLGPDLDVRKDGRAWEGVAQVTLRVFP